MNRIQQILACAFSLSLLIACGPTYPNCETDEHCAQKNEVCVDKLCKECRSDAQCNQTDPCGACQGDGSCGRTPNCCTSDADCTGNGLCYKPAGAVTGRCGAECNEANPCPAGQTCNAQGMCEPDAECSAATPCPPGKKCDNGQCVDACTLQAINFDFDESRVKLGSRDTLSANAECIKLIGKSVVVEGHCDERGDEEYNLALGERRSLAAIRYLKNLGIAKRSLRPFSKGYSEPVCMDSNESCWSRNRRAEFIFE